MVGSSWPWGNCRPPLCDLKCTGTAVVALSEVGKEQAAGGGVDSGTDESSVTVHTAERCGSGKSKHVASASWINTFPLVRN